ncbi:uncharacterized protein LOC110414661 isoform X2 [Herrania umbratica]|uniref:Uncharacterized protein LOC110414661 isoform X2 n=1 Tax=Herrania umbratica TaxID=108875 RepID=A0A6J1A3G5_9ROSI|nr:uncharacterized protein LOC110414661 isoform X2 [Herrania umbratica]
MLDEGFYFNLHTNLGFKCSQFSSPTANFVRKFLETVIQTRSCSSSQDSNIDAGNREPSKLISELQAKLEDANAETLAEREKAKKLAVENEKLKYRIVHLVQAVSEADQKLESMRGHVSEATAQKLEKMRL